MSEDYWVVPDMANKSCTGALVRASGSEDDLCEYEKRRLENIRVNEDVMTALGKCPVGAGWFLVF